MKLLPRIALVAVGLCGALPSAHAQAPDAPSMLKEGLAAYASGDLPTAKRDFQLVLQLDPKNAVASNYLRLIAQRGGGGGAAAAGLDKQLGQIILPKIEFKEATLGSVLEYLQQQVEKTSQGKTAVSFVVKLPEEQVKTQPITLALRNVPVTEVLRYIGELANITFSYEKYAVVVRPKDGAAARPASAPAQ